MKKHIAPPLQTIYFYPTESCNLKCRHCWIAPPFAESSSAQAYAGQNRANLSFDEIKAVIEDALPLGLNSIKLTGGEPFLHPRVMDYLRYFKKKNLSLTIETNGTLLDEDIIVELKKMGCGTSISMDGASAATHDRVRGVPGSFDRVMRALQLMKKRDYRCEVIFTLFKETRAELIKIIEVLNELKGFTLKINPLSPMGRGEQLANASSGLPVEEILELHRAIEQDYSRRYRNVPIYLHIPAAFTPIKSILKGQGCTTCMIRNIIGLLSDGRVSYCGIGRLENDLVLGNVRDKKMSAIWKNSRQLREFRKKMPRSLKGICGACIHKNQCLGSCVAQTYHEKKDLFGAFSFCEAACDKGLFPESRLVRTAGAGL
jgi:SynChlorMet cassette radical SAM/SPASM protein ScmF